MGLGALMRSYAASHLPYLASDVLVGPLVAQSHPGRPSTAARGLAFVAPGEHVKRPTTREEPP